MRIDSLIRFLLFVGFSRSVLCVRYIPRKVSRNPIAWQGAAYSENKRALYLDKDTERLIGPFIYVSGYSGNNSEGRHVLNITTYGSSLVSFRNNSDFHHHEDQNSLGGILPCAHPIAILL